MKRHLIIPFLLFTLTMSAQNTASKFSNMEINHLRVATPGLFKDSTYIDMHLEDMPDSSYCFPLPEAKVISSYGRYKGSHSGIDIKTCAKDTIRAAFSGVVRMAKPYAAYGKLVVIRHSSGLETAYSHNSKNLVKSGDVVKAGDPIALTGRTGRASTEHLHFETRINGQHFNPNLLFDFEKRTLRKECIRCTKKGTSISVKHLTKKAKEDFLSMQTFYYICQRFTTETI